MLPFYYYWFSFLLCKFVAPVAVVISLISMYNGCISSPSYSTCAYLVTLICIVSFPYTSGHIVGVLILWDEWAGRNILINFMALLPFFPSPSISVYTSQARRQPLHDSSSSPTIHPSFLEYSGQTLHVQKTTFPVPKCIQGRELPRGFRERARWWWERKPMQVSKFGNGELVDPNMSYTRRATIPSMWLLAGEYTINILKFPDGLMDKAKEWEIA